MKILDPHKYSLPDAFFTISGHQLKKCCSLRRTCTQRIVVGVLVAGILCSPAFAETLPLALVKAADNNPQLLAARSALLAVEEEIVFARGGYRPTLSADANASHSDLTDENIAIGSIGLQLNQSLYDGKATHSAIGSAKAMVQVAKAEVATIMQEVLLATVSAYADVRRDTELVRVRESNLTFLNEQVSISQQRYELGYDTQTAVSQAEAQSAEALARLAAALAQLEASRATYQEIIGEEPIALEPATPPSAILPNTLIDAFGLMGANHPALIRAREAVTFAEFNIQQSRSVLRPNVSLSARLERLQDDLPIDDFRRQDGSVASISLQLRVPIYQAGQASARLRQSYDVYNQREQEVFGIERSLRTLIQTAWHQLIAARSASLAITRQVSAAELARNGKVEEQEVGLVTTQDVLTAQQEILEARVATAQTNRDELVAAYSLLSAVGQLSTQALGLSSEL